MGLLRFILRKVTQPIRAKAHGVQGEIKVKRALNPLIIGRVEHRQINGWIFVDERGGSHQVDHIEIRENGIFVIETKFLKGKVYGSPKGERWTQYLYGGEKHSIYNPLKQNETHCYYVKKALKNKFKVHSIVVMANNNSYHIRHPNVIDLDNLKRYLANFDDGTRYSLEEMEEAYGLLLLAHSDITNAEHVKNIKKAKANVSNNICPRCGGDLVLRKGKYGSFYGCSNYPSCKFIKKS